MAMNAEMQAQQATKQEATESGVEQTRDRRVFVPRVDIYESGDDLILVADMPGVDENNVDITLEQDRLTIVGQVDPVTPNGYTLAYAEYAEGDYRRTFTLSNEIDRDHIEATMSNGVLRLRLPKAAPAKARKIAVKAA